MDHTDTDPTTTERAPKSRRDADAARARAAAMVATANTMAAAVAAYHDAADRIDAAQNELTAAGAARLDALRQLRHCGLPVSEIADLSGLSASRIQSLLKDAR
jgi:DNA-directed RNA polymerase specialized sigma24 family protein